MHTLYVVATPIGNLEDVTLRALRVLNEVGLVAAEDTRVTRRLLNRHGIRTPLTSYHEHNKAAKIPSLLATLADKDIALVCDAGVPGISDPGHELVSAVAAAGFPAVPIPGPSAVTSAIAVSGLPVDQFVYLGFLPRNRTERLKLLDSLASETRTLIAFETPHRLSQALRDIFRALGDRLISVGRELTKLHEEVFRGTVSQAQAHFGEPRGEFTLVISGSHGGDPAVDVDAARRSLAKLRQEGCGAKDAVAMVSREQRMSRRDVYRLWLENV